MSGRPDVLTSGRPDVDRDVRTSGRPDGEIDQPSLQRPHYVLEDVQPETSTEDLIKYVVTHRQRRDVGTLMHSRFRTCDGHSKKTTNEKDN